MVTLIWKVTIYFGSKYDIKDHQSQVWNVFKNHGNITCLCSLRSIWISIFGSLTKFEVSFNILLGVH